MKIVNEKGKLFGIINVVDLIVLVVILAMVGAIGVQLLGARVKDAVADKADCYAEVAIIGAAPRIYEEVLRQDLIGKRLVSGNEYLGATIEDIWLEDYVMQNPTYSGEIVNATDPTKKRLSFC